ncbi:Hsp20/alpha crystallin family protein [Rhizobium sp. CECT 9324]|uniref:Hsp20/alpha crystallin family protein n=1 Tax=Rhizobium sp. CECT 9324 TaxID=2845820 RepID=UPI001E308F65|nr:Hsp20/alpha crystallin family protein [Rhizobium sp. CECT 9324]CAH0342584.1 Spore protein SP21 [Rhizobium sp. CECT 9324]
MRITDIVPWRGSGRDVTARTAPMDPVRGLQLDVDRAFENFWRMMPYPFSAIDRLPWVDTVRVDVADSGKEITVTAELPGMNDTDIEVSISDGLLTIRGEKKSDHEAETNGILVSERTYGAMERTVPLPDGIDPDGAKATFRNGVLTLVIPRSPELQADTKRIPVQAG